MPDFFTVSKWLPLFLNPLPLFLLFVFLVGLFTRRKSKLAGLIPLAAVLFWVASTPWCADQLARWWEEPRKAAIEVADKADVAIVLGGLSNPLSSTRDHLELSSAAERLVEAVQLYRNGKVGALLITSGSGDVLHPEAAEAPELAAFARAWGVPEKDLLVEGKSRNTHENATLSLPLVTKKGWKKVVLVTSAWHMKRALGVFRKAGYQAEGRTLTTWPVDTAESRTAWPFNAVPDPASLGVVQTVLKEAVGWDVYLAQGYL